MVLSPSAQSEKAYKSPQQEQKETNTSPKSCPPAIVANSTFDSHESVSEDSVPNTPVRQFQRRTLPTRREELERRWTAQGLFRKKKEKEDSASDCKDDATGKESRIQRLSRLQSAVYISTFANFGAVLRIYIGRFFGLDCEHYKNDMEVHSRDLFTPLARQICITSSGYTSEQGGAIFTDLPANMIGTLLMGMLSAEVITESPLPWFRSNHRLQKHRAFQTALKVGLCGCLTTFASWNMQMIVMMDGTATEYGSQVPSAIFGYILGFVCTISSFACGRHLSFFLRSMHSQSLVDHTDVEANIQETRKGCNVCREDKVPVCVQYMISAWSAPFILLACLISAFFVGDFVYENEFYRVMWMTLLVSPLGALLRWLLADLNKCKGIDNLRYIPWGTLLSNVLACAFSSLAEASDTHVRAQHNGSYGWTHTLLSALQKGFAGSLSTVSSFIAELYRMEEVQHSYVYAMLTVTLSMLVSFILYSPLVRNW